MLCEWCYDAAATGSVELKPAHYGTDKRTGVKVVKRPAKKLSVCPDCKRKVDEQLDRAERMKRVP
jgi:ribosomal protein L37AE/L43A